jgi:hypothetical protein
VAKSNAERQAEFRSRRKARNGQNLNIEIGAGTDWLLTQLATFHKKSKREMLEEIITHAVVETTDKHGKAAFFDLGKTPQADEKTLDLFVTP